MLDIHGSFLFRVFSTQKRTCAYAGAEGEDEEGRGRVERVAARHEAASRLERVHQAWVEREESATDRTIRTFHIGIRSKFYQNSGKFIENFQKISEI